MTALPSSRPSLHAPEEMHRGVPRANVIDLRKLQQEREAKKQESAQRVTWRERVRGINVPSVRLPSFSFRFSWHEWFSRWKRRARSFVVVSRAPSKRQAPAIDTTPRPAEQRENVPDAEHLDFRQFQLPVGWQRRLASFTIVCLLVTLPIYGLAYYQRATAAKRSVETLSQQALSLVAEGGASASASRYENAATNFSEAAQTFSAAQTQLKEAGGLVGGVAGLVPGKVASAQHLLQAGEQLTEAAADITALVSQLGAVSLDPQADGESSLTDFLVQARNNIDPIRTELTAARESLQKVRLKDLPDEYRGKVSAITDSLPVLLDNFDQLNQQSDLLLAVLGHDRPMRYLLLFQNNRELRPTGGFIGSVALMDIAQGRIEKMEVPGGGVYDLAGQLSERLVAPKPLWLINPHWNIQDSNWFPDFPASARKAMWFFERTGGASADGVLALTPAVVERLLAITGPIDMQADYGVTVTSDSFVAQAQQWAEVDYDREENQPKKFIGDLLPKLLGSVFDAKPENVLPVVHAITTSLNDRNFLLYMSDEGMERRVSSFGWDGSLLHTDKDYLYVVSANIGGGKTDHVIEQQIQHAAQIQQDGSIVDTVTVRRAHRGNLLDPWESVANVSYLRFYLPKGSTLVSARGFDRIPSFRYQLPDADATDDADLTTVERDSIIQEGTDTRLTSEFGKTVVGNWMTLDPGQTKEVTIQYVLPFKLRVGGLFGRADSYSLLVQRQPGSPLGTFVGSVELPRGYDVEWRTADLATVGTTLTIAHDFGNDLFYGALLK